MSDLTQQRLKEVVHYDAESGAFTWRVSRGTAKAGSRAGTYGRNKYHSIHIDRSTYYAHRLAWLYVYGEFPPDGIDHINGVAHDNRIYNLRLADHRVNGKNAKRYANNSSGYPGISWREDCRKWECRLRVDGRNLYLGVFTHLDDAIQARKEAERKNGFHENHGRVDDG